MCLEVFDFSLCGKMLNSIKKIENKIAIVQEKLESLQDELSALKSDFMCLLRRQSRLNVRETT